MLAHGVDVDAAVLVAGVQPVAGDGVVLEAEGVDAVDRQRLQVEHGDRVVLLKRHPGGEAVLGDRDVLGLEVERRQRRAVDPDARWQLPGSRAARVECLEADRRHRKRCCAGCTSMTLTEPAWIDLPAR